MDMVRSASLEAAAGQQFRTESTYFVASGEERIVDLILAPVTDTSGRVLFVAATGTDITDRRMLEDSLRETDRRKDEFIALLAHELRNPLAPIQNGLHLMRLAGGDPDTVEQVREMMERQLGHMVRLVDDLLDLARIGQNKIELRRSRVALTDVVNSAVETARPMIDEAGHAFSVSMPAEPLFLDADPTRLAQVFSNLLTNSARYTERGGRIWLDARRQADQAVVSVRDTGIGIPAAALPRLFEMFSQVDRSVERATGGLGIGLALVKGLAEMHGGTVTVESPGLGLGSTFSVRLPLAQGVPEPAPPAPADRGAMATAWRILVVDDSEDSARSMAKVLKLLKNEVRTANDGEQAVQAASAFRPDVILMDLGMPRVNGYEATRQIRELDWGRSVAIIALTGWGQDIDRAKSREAGFDGHLVKPVNLAELERLLAELRRGNLQVSSHP
jgi:signal transduction histidine kinase/ActR/RegA family two-component response regulator